MTTLDYGSGGPSNFTIVQYRGSLTGKNCETCQDSESVKHHRNDLGTLLQIAVISGICLDPDRLKMM